MINIKSKKGFTLIELLVVIGILAVLAAIAIPSVAGLIDRANVSSDKTNSNEMTNAMERFTSEYELYCQDIASGALDTSNLDSAQGRVYNVTKATTRGDIEVIEIAQDEVVADNVVAIYRDTKYPANAYTAQLIVDNYTKTSSSTYEPKQSDMAYWYSPDCGTVVVASPNATKEQLNALIVSGRDAKGNELGPDTEWVNLTNETTVSGDSDNTEDPTPVGETIPEGAYYVKADGTTLYAGEVFPETSVNNDEYFIDGYSYKYFDSVNGWRCKVATDKTLQTYPEILSSVNGCPVTSLSGAFNGCSNLTTAPMIPSSVTSIYQAFKDCTSLKNYVGNLSAEGDFSGYQLPAGLKDMYGAFEDCDLMTTTPRIPSNVTNMEYTFFGCGKLTTAQQIPNGVTNMKSTFRGCSALTNAPAIPNTVTAFDYAFYGCSKLAIAPAIPSGIATMSYAFANCTSITEAPVIPNTVTDLRYAFQGCTSLTTVSIIPASVQKVSYAFKGCTALTGTIVVDANPSSYTACFQNVDMSNITLAGSSTTKTTLANTGVNGGKVTITN